MKYVGLYNNNQDIATKEKIDEKQDKVLVDGILQGDGTGAISAAEIQEVELVTLTKADVGLDNVDNTSDANKPISTATQTALNAKQATITGGATTITTSNLTANRALVSNSSGKVAASDVTSTELGYLDGVTSNIQTQLNSKLSTAPVTSVNNKIGAVSLTATDVSAIPSTLTGTAGQVLTKTADGQEWKDATSPQPSTTAPLAPAETASAGTSTEYARGDHVHPKQSVSKADVGLGNVDNVSINTRLNRTTNVNAADTNYTTYMARGEALFSSETTPTVNGCIAWQYG